MFVYKRDTMFDGGFVANRKPAGAEIFEETPPTQDQAVADFATQQIRADGMTVALAWIDGGDFTFGALDGLAQGVADLDGDMEIGADEEAYYNDVLLHVGEAMVGLGADAENVQAFLDSEDDAAGAKLGAYLSEKMDSNDADDGDLINNFAVGNDVILEGLVKRIRNGQVTFVMKKHRARKISAAQRMALKSARLKANTSAAKRARKKSFHIGQKMGIHK